MRRRLTGLFIGIIVLVLTSGCASLSRITEDDPRWDCRTMGNHVCGPVLPGDDECAHVRDPALRETCRAAAGEEHGGVQPPYWPEPPLDDCAQRYHDAPPDTPPASFGHLCH